VSRITLTAFAKRLNVARMTAVRWRDRGLFDVGEDNKVVYDDAIAQIRRRADHNVLAKLKLRPLSRPATHATQNEEGRTLADEHLRLESAKADQAELKAAELAKRLVDVEQAAIAWANMVSRVRERLLTIPADIAGHLAATDTPHEAEVLVKKAITEALTALSEEPPT